MIVYPLLRSLAPIRPNIADRQDLHVFAPRVAASDISPRPAKQMSSALAANTNESHVDSITGREEACATQC